MSTSSAEPGAEIRRTSRERAAERLRGAGAAVRLPVLVSYDALYTLGSVLISILIVDVLYGVIDPRIRLS